MRRVFCYGSLFFCMFIGPAAVAHAEGEGSDRTGLLSGVLEKAESSVKETTESVENIVGSAAEEADQTLQDAVSFSKDTVVTVENITPAVKKTTETVQTATSEVAGIVEELPEDPVVIPVLDELSTVVDETTMTKITKTSKLLQEKESSVINEQNDEEIGQPVFDSNKDKKMVTPIDSSEVVESIETIVDVETNFIPNEDPLETASRSVNQVAKVAKTKEETPEIPVQSSTQWDGNPIAVTTSTTSVFSPLVSIGGSADFVPGIVDGMAILCNLSSRQWIHSDENMRVQWVHAPPGQPPQSTPFLQAKK